MKTNYRGYQWRSRRHWDTAAQVWKFYMEFYVVDDFGTLILIGFNRRPFSNKYSLQ